MLADNDVVATIPVSDLAIAREFYEKKLGLLLDATLGDYCLIYRAGDTRVFIYESVTPIPSPVVMATWAVEDMLESIVLEMQSKGVVFEHFEKPGFEREGDVYHADNFKVALFKDPDGNLLSLFQSDM